MDYHYTYISYDEQGNKYHGVRTSKDKTPWEDNYLGSFEDKTFRPIGKFIQRIFSNRFMIEKDQFNQTLHKKSGPNAGKKWTLDPLTRRRIYL